MIDKDNFIGMSGFIWWVGVIEQRVDPLAMGRCKVRIFGWHTENTSLLPSDDLPWSMSLFPVNNSLEWTAPLIGDWVVGFFMDGENAQFPVMMGVLPYIKDKSINGKNTG
jgi:hypothetical protein